MICMKCLEPCDYVLNDKGTLVCQNCYHHIYNKKKYINQNEIIKPVTIFDLKRKWEKK